MSHAGISPIVPVRTVEVPESAYVVRCTGRRPAEAAAQSPLPTAKGRLTKQCPSRSWRSLARESFSPIIPARATEPKHALGTRLRGGVRVLGRRSRSRTWVKLSAELMQMASQRGGSPCWRCGVTKESIVFVLCASMSKMSWNDAY